MHAFVWILNAAKIRDETEHKSFVERIISILLPDPESEPELFELVKLYQIHSIEGHAGNIKKVNAGFHMGVYFQIEL